MLCCSLRLRVGGWGDAWRRDGIKMGWLKDAASAREFQLKFCNSMYPSLAPRLATAPENPQRLFTINRMS